VSDELKYVEIRPREREDLESSFKSKDPNKVCDALYSAAQHEVDWRWSQGQCLKMLNHESVQVRSAALMALGEIAIFRGHLDLETVLPKIQHLADDPALRSSVDNFYESISMAKLLQ
jgi:hypothetical protein